MASVQIFPSLISADLLNLRAELNRYDSLVDGYHIDVMDFHYVPNLTIGPDFINELRKATSLPFMVHLMVQYPERCMERFELQKGDIVSIHPESISDVSITCLIEKCQKKGWVPSLAFNPETSLSLITDLVIVPQHILLMAVNPGFSGQKMLPSIYHKLTELEDLKIKGNYDFITAVDGGINLSNAMRLKEQGANQLVLGSALFSSPNPLNMLQDLRNLLD